MIKKIKKWWLNSSISFFLGLCFSKRFFHQPIDEWLKINWKIFCSYQYEHFQFIARPGTGFKSEEDFEYLVSNRNTRKRCNGQLMQVTVLHYDEFKNRDGLKIEKIWWLPNPEIIMATSESRKADARLKFQEWRMLRGYDIMTDDKSTTHKAKASVLQP